MAYIIRSMMSVPGIRERFIEKAQEIPADVILFDLEDSVAVPDKPKARALVAKALPDFPAKGRMLFVRVNGLETGLMEADLDTIVGPWLHGINVPKTHNSGVIQRIDHYLTFLEKVRGLESGHVKLIPWIETTEGVAKCYEVCASSPRLIGAAMGGEDYATSLGVRRTHESNEINFARVAVANAARACGLVPIDTPEPDYQDVGHFEKDILYARSIGYRGKFCIHPTQVEIANRVFAPNPEDIAWARRVVEAYDEGEREGLGAVALDGYMIDRPIVLRARELLDWQRQVEEREAALRS